LDKPIAAKLRQVDVPAKMTWRAGMGRYTQAAKLTGLAQIAAERGTDLRGLLGEAGRAPAMLRSPETVIDYSTFCDLLHRPAKSHYDPGGRRHRLTS